MRYESLRQIRLLWMPVFLLPGTQRVGLASHLVDDQVLALRRRDQGEVVAMAADVLRHLVHLGLCAIAAQSAPESAAESARLEQAQRLIIAGNRSRWSCLGAWVALPDQESSGTLSKLNDTWRSTGPSQCTSCRVESSVTSRTRSEPQ